MPDTRDKARFQFRLAWLFMITSVTALLTALWLGAIPPFPGMLTTMGIAFVVTTASAVAAVTTDRYLRAFFLGCLATQIPLVLYLFGDLREEIRYYWILPANTPDILRPTHEAWWLVATRLMICELLMSMITGLIGVGVAWLIGKQRNTSIS